MRFLSHEIRTPLNSVYVGLTIMLKELQQLGGQDQDQQRNLLETVVDTHKSCESAIDILDHMVLYDRIAHGLEKLDKTAFNPWLHICDIVDSFRTQVLLWFYLVTYILLSSLSY